MTENHSKRTAAVALKHDPQKGGTPTVTAAGYGHLAEKNLETPILNLENLLHSGLMEQIIMIPTLQKISFLTMQILHL